MEPFTAMMFILLIWVSRAKGEIRCYCNDASCVSTSYMCKSPSGKCFSEIPPEGRELLATSARGCVESLPVPDRTVCTAQDDMIKTHNGKDRVPIYICCREDMCNYQDMDINNYVPKSNGSILKGQRTNHRGTSYKRGDTEYRYVDDRYQQRDLWFKAAVIAVPIAGGFILILLVLLAIRMLRNDSRRHRQLMHMRRHRSLAKAQLYVADHFCEKNERHAHYNCIDHSNKQNNVYKDVNIKVDSYEGHGYEKMRDSPPQPGSRNSIIIWGKPGKAEPASVV